ncbi:Rhamnogalacturonate lyase [Linum grandiflorum]
MAEKKSLSVIRALCWVFFLFSTVCFAAVDGAAFAGAGAVVETPGARITNVRFSASAVQFHQETDRVIIDNGIVRVTFASPAGHIIGIRYKYVDNLLETENEHDNRGYWDVVWNKPGERGDFDRLAASHFRVVSHTEHQIEVSFSKKWTPRGSYSDSTVPLNVDKRFILRKGSHGIYMYTILERLEGWPDVDMDQIRVVFKLQDKLFRYMVISDDTQRVMPTMKDRTSGRSLAYKEAVLLTHPANPALRGEVDDKYQYSCEDQDNKVHGWISESQRIGFWMITPSDEFRVGGPVKQDLTSHAGPAVLNMFTSTHYAGKDMNTEYRNGEPWKKVLGPVFVYMNSGRTSMLWREAKKQMRSEVRSWPYGFVSSEDFPSEQERGTVFGQLFLRDRYVNDNKLAAAGSAYVGLAAPGEEGSWQTDAKGYQFWTRADEDGKFSIEHIRPGNYSLYGWVPGVIGENMYKTNITILPGKLTSSMFLMLTLR